MVSRGISWFAVVLLCVFWLSQDSLKVTCQSSGGTASLISTLGVKRGRFGGEEATEDDVIAMQAALKKSLDKGKGKEAHCEESFMKADGTHISLLNIPSSSVNLVQTSVSNILATGKVTKGLLRAMIQEAEEVGGELCAVKKHLVCVEGTCKVCGDLTAAEKRQEMVKKTCDAADKIAPSRLEESSGGERRGCSPPLMFLGLICVWVGILQSAFRGM